MLIHSFFFMLSIKPTRALQYPTISESLKILTLIKVKAVYNISQSSIIFWNIWTNIFQKILKFTRWRIFFASFQIWSPSNSLKAYICLLHHNIATLLNKDSPTGTLRQKKIFCDFSSTKHFCGRKDVRGLRVEGLEKQIPLKLYVIKMDKRRIESTFKRA